MKLFIFICYIIIFTSGCDSDIDHSPIHQFPPLQEPDFSKLSPYIFILINKIQIR